MSWDRFKTWTWTVVLALHSDYRVAALLRTLAVVGIVGGFGGFMIGLNPLVAGIVVQFYDPPGDLMVRVGVAGLLVHMASMGYYYATTPGFTEDGLIRY